MKTNELSEPELASISGGTILNADLPMTLINAAEFLANLIVAVKG